jgi:hypothetical protein
MNDSPVTPQNEIEELGHTGPATWGINPWPLVAGLLGVVAVVALLGSPTAPSTDVPALAHGAPPPASPTPMPSVAGPVVAGTPLTISEPLDGARLVGNVVHLRGTSAGALGPVEAKVMVGGRVVGSVAADIGAGAFDLAVPAIAAPFRTDARLVLADENGPLVARRVELQPTPGVGLVRIAADASSSALTLDGVAPRHVKQIGIRILDEVGAVVAASTAETVASDGWGGAMLAAATFRARVDLAGPPRDAGTVLTVELSWSDPWAEATSEARLAVVVPGATAPGERVDVRG